MLIFFIFRVQMMHASHSTASSKIMKILSCNITRTNASILFWLFFVFSCIFGCSWGKIVIWGYRKQHNSYLDQQLLRSIARSCQWGYTLRNMSSYCKWRVLGATCLLFQMLLNIPTWGQQELHLEVGHHVARVTLWLHIKYMAIIHLYVHILCF